MKRIGKISILLISGILFTFTLYKSFYYDNIFSLPIYLILGGIYLYIFYYFIFEDIKNYKESKSITSFLPTFLGAILVLINVSIYSYFQYRFSSPTLINANMHGAYFHFDTRGNYVINSGSWGSKKRFYGKYIIKDSLIVLDKKNFDEMIISDRMVVRSITNAVAFEKSFYDNSGKSKRYLIQVDDSGKEIKNFKTYQFNPERIIYRSYKFKITDYNVK